MYTANKTGSSKDVKSINLYVKKIMLIKSTKNGERNVRAIHSPSKLEGEGRTDQEAFDALLAELQRHKVDIGL